MVPCNNFQPSLMFQCKAEDYPKKPLSDAPLFSKLLASPTRLKRRGTNALAYSPIGKLQRKKFYNNDTWMAIECGELVAISTAVSFKAMEDTGKR